MLSTPALGAVVPDPGPQRLRPGSAWWLVGLMAGLGATDASASGVGSLATSTGLLATLLAVFAMKGWPALGPAASTAGGALIVAAALAWIVPGRAGGWLRAVIARGQGLVRRGALARPSVAKASVGAGEALRASGLDPAALGADLVVLFMRVQAAWDRAELAALRDSTTPEMLRELMGERAHWVAEGGPTRTKIVSVEADLCGYEVLGGDELLTVAFSGSLREGLGRQTQPFREVWLLTRSGTPGSAWKLARHQTLY